MSIQYASSDMWPSCLCALFYMKVTDSLIQEGASISPNHPYTVSTTRNYRFSLFWDVMLASIVIQDTLITNSVIFTISDCHNYYPLDR